jgi:hypothetical protein
MKPQTKLGGPKLGKSALLRWPNHSQSKMSPSSVSVCTHGTKQRSRESFLLKKAASRDSAEDQPTSNGWPGQSRSMTSGA